MQRCIICSIYLFALRTLNTLVGKTDWYITNCKNLDECCSRGTNESAMWPQRSQMGQSQKTSGRGGIEAK